MSKLDKQDTLISVAIALLLIALIGAVGTLVDRCSPDDSKVTMNLSNHDELSDFLAGRAATYTNGTRPGGWTFELYYNTENLTYRIVDTNTGGIVEQRPIPDRFLIQPNRPMLCSYVQGERQ